MNRIVFLRNYSYHPNIKLYIEISPTKFLDAEISRCSCGKEGKVYNKSKKLPVHWSSKIPTRYKQNAITGEFHIAKRMANDFNFEVKRLTKKL